LKIEFGCGENPTKKEFMTSDIRDVPGVDFVCTAWDIEQHIQPNTVDEIFSRHFFEHLTFIQGEKVLQAWFNIMKSGARMEMMLPNMTFHIKQWLDRNDMEHAKAGFWGWQREGEYNVWDVHKSGYDFDLLKATVEAKGFTGVNLLRRATHKHLHIECFKP
jgi:predicted SAM-dependent methyltransferase